MTDRWQFWIDVGGTFTDCIGISPAGRLHQFKTLSSGRARGAVGERRGSTFTDTLRSTDPPSFWVGAQCRLLDADGILVAEAVVAESAADQLRLDEIEKIPDTVVSYDLNAGLPAPVLAIRRILNLAAGAPCPPVHVRFGTTRGTNALLTRTGARTALLTTAGFEDVPLIGNQDRPDLFALDIRKPDPLFTNVIGISERINAQGEVLTELNADATQRRLIDAGLTPDRFDSVAICLMNAYASPHHEQVLEKIVRDMGFREVSRSTEVSPRIRFVPRCDTTVLDAYLNPVLRSYLDEIQSRLPNSTIQVMTSGGGLVDRRHFRGRDCVLSGPAGGIVGFSAATEAEGFDRAIGFDMGGTSTDVARYDRGFQFDTETVKAGVRILAPMLAIETVAAGGGSICQFDGTRLSVGPDSAGADPGPACYGAGGPLTVTDLNVYLGRVLAEHFPFPLHLKAIERELQSLLDQLSASSPSRSVCSMTTYDLAEGLLQIANDNMVQAIRRVSVAEGYHPADYVLVCFGGAGGQHACTVARQLGMGQVLIHPLAGILSAFGMGYADIKSIHQKSILKTLEGSSQKAVAAVFEELERACREEVLRQSEAADQTIDVIRHYELRYKGTDSTLQIPESDSLRAAFEREHQRMFGFHRPDRPVEIAAIRVECTGRNSSSYPYIAEAQVDEPERCSTTIRYRGRQQLADVYQRAHLQPGQVICGPAIICEPTSTIFLEPNCTASVRPSGAILINVAAESGNTCEMDETTTAQAADPVMLEVFNNQFVSIAEQMGETLRRTSTSTNVRERLDFSCALFDADGQLVVNAPHVPVHLGAMGETVRAVMRNHADMQPGDVFVTNDPFRGGSHLPDVTVITPVFPDSEIDHPAYFVASRAHHAEIGGIVPGSMPPFSKSLADEGILIRSQHLIAAGESRESLIEQLLKSGPHPSRDVESNLADLAAQTAANECGVRLLREITTQFGRPAVADYMKYIQLAATQKMRQCLSQLENGTTTFTDQLDDGTRLCVTITIKDESATVDFTGTDGVHHGNLNANGAITTAAVMYAFRCLLNDDIPLNAGVLTPITVILPSGLLNPPEGNTPETCPAIVGGNVETSQRIVDVLLGALQLAAGSQGTMNNLTFGDESFGYYETICGGAGATPRGPGADAVHTHMTNTRLTDPEVLEQRYPIQLRQFSIRAKSGGRGQYDGGNGIIRELLFLRPLRVSVLSQRRTSQPYGLAGGQPGAAGINRLYRSSEKTWIDCDGCLSVTVALGDILRIETPGGGGCGPNPETRPAGS